MKSNAILLIAEDHTAFRNLLREVIEAEPTFKEIGESCRTTQIERERSGTLSMPILPKARSRASLVWNCFRKRRDGGITGALLFQ